MAHLQIITPLYEQMFIITHLLPPPTTPSIASSLVKHPIYFPSPSKTQVIALDTEFNSGKPRLYTPDTSPSHWYEYALRKINKFWWTQIFIRVSEHGIGGHSNEYLLERWSHLTPTPWFKCWSGCVYDGLIQTMDTSIENYISLICRDWITL